MKGKDLVKLMARKSGSKRKKSLILELRDKFGKSSVAIALNKRFDVVNKFSDRLSPKNSSMGHQITHPNKMMKKWLKFTEGWGY